MVFSVVPTTNPGRHRRKAKTCEGEGKKKKEIPIENSSNDDDDDVPINRLASKRGADHDISQAYDTIESPVFEKRKRGKKAKKSGAETGEAEEFATVGKDCVKIVNIPHPEYSSRMVWKAALPHPEVLLSSSGDVLGGA